VADVADVSDEGVSDSELNVLLVDELSDLDDEVELV
jgi:hypothetical protein